MDGIKKQGAMLIPALGLIQICGWGTLFYSFPLIGEAMRADLGWTKTEIYGAATIGLILAAVFAIPVGVMIDRGWGRTVLAGGYILAGLALMCWSLVTSLAWFYVVFGLIGSLCAFTLYEPAFAVIARIRGARDARGGIMALTLWAGFASTIFIPFIQLCLDQMGWRATLVVLGVIDTGLCGPLALLMIPGMKAQMQKSVARRGDGREKQALLSVLRRPVFWMLMIAMITYSSIFSVLSFHLYPYLLEKGLTAGHVVTVMAIIGPSQIGGRLLIQFLAPAASSRFLGSVIVIFFPIVIAGLLWVPPDIFLIGMILVTYGAANGMMTIVRGLVVPDMVTQEAYGTISGALTAPVQLVQALGPVVAAMLWASGRSYEPVLLGLLVLSFILAASFWLAARIAKSERLEAPR